MIDPHSPAHGRLVIVEDEGILALDLERNLREAGFDVRGVAANSEAAIAMVDQERPDLVLMDIRIQGTVDGIDTAAVLRSRFDVPVVYLTAHSDTKTIERAQRTEPLGYLLKPFKKPDLRNVVTIALARNETERNLRRREQTLATTLSCLGEAVITTDAEGKVTYLNTAANDFVATQPPPLDQPLTSVLPLQPRTGAADLLREAQTKGRVEFETTIAKPEGTRNVVGTAAALTQGSSSFGVVIALRDLTELLTARRQLEFSERLASLGTLAAGVAHEINNPLSVVMGNLDFALADPVLSHELRESLGEAHEAAQRVARIVADLRQLSRPQTDPARPIQLTQVMSSALAFTRALWRSNASVAVELGAAPCVMASSTRLAQVITNLIINAVQAMQGTKGDPPQLTLTSGTDREGSALLSVEDNGPGIGDDLIGRIFEPFFTTKSTGKGTGLGLSISRSIVQNLRGEIEVSRASHGHGAKFTIRLPAAPEQVRAPSPKVVWVGPASAEATRVLQTFGGTHLEDESTLGDRLAELKPDLVLFDVPADRIRALRGALPDLERQGLWVTTAVPEPGVVALRPGFDLGALAAYARRNDVPN